MFRPLCAFVVAMVVVVARGAPGAAQSDATLGTFEARVETLAIIQTLNSQLLASTSATATLAAWCRDHAMADDPRIVARRVTGGGKPATDEQVQRLQVNSGPELSYRHVELRCGAHLFSEADNWYVPARLTPAMNALLSTTDTPFGQAVQTLHPYRRTFAMKMLWLPLPAGWEQQRRPHPDDPRPGPVIPADLFEHRAVVYTQDGVPFSEVDEIYKSGVLDFDRGAR